MRADEEDDTTAESMALPPRPAKGEEDEICCRLSTEVASRRKIAAAGVAGVVEDEVELQEAAGDEYITTARINRSINQSREKNEARQKPDDEFEISEICFLG
jgi:hypothetical protein